MWTYTGETGDPADLVDLGADVQNHYRGKEEEMFEVLELSARDAREKLGRLKEHGIHTNLISIERHFGPIIKSVVAEFSQQFPNNLHDMGTDATQEQIGDWLQQKFGVREGWLLYFVEQESGYRMKQSVKTSDAKEPLVYAALKEGLLYLLMTHYLHQNGTVMYDLETTHEYVRGSLNHLPGPVILGASYDPNNPESRFNIRQPFNTPIRL